MLCNVLNSECYHTQQAAHFLAQITDQRCLAVSKFWPHWVSWLLQQSHSLSLMSGLMGSTTSCSRTLEHKMNIYINGKTSTKPCVFMVSFYVECKFNLTIKPAETVWKRYGNVTVYIPVGSVTFLWYTIEHQSHCSHSWLCITWRLRLPGFIMRISSGLHHLSWKRLHFWSAWLNLAGSCFASLRWKHIWKKSHGSISSWIHSHFYASVTHGLLSGFFSPQWMLPSFGDANFRCI